MIVLKDVPKAPHNLLWQLFSAQQEKVQDAARHYSESGSEINPVINLLLSKYQAEGINMPYTLEDFRKEYVRSGLNLLTPEEVLTHYKPEQRLAGLAPEERLAGLSAKDRKWLAELLAKEQSGDPQAPDKA